MFIRSILAIIPFLWAFHTNAIHRDEGEQHYLHPSQRPPALVSAGKDLYGNISSKERSDWGAFNGSRSYSIGTIQDVALIRAYVERAYEAGQRHFTFLDVGAGDFTWVNAGAPMEAIQKNFYDLVDVTFTLIGVRGEEHETSTKTETLSFDLYGNKKFTGPRVVRINVGNFSMEDFSTAMKAHGLEEFYGHIDIAVSHWGLIHLADPLGTVVDIFNWLRPKTGMLLSSVFYAIEETKANTYPLEHFRLTGGDVWDLLASSPGVGVLEAGISRVGTAPFADVVIVKQGTEGLQIPYAYSNAIRAPKGSDTASKVIQLFIRTGNPVKVIREEAPFTGTDVQYVLDEKPVEALYRNMLKADELFLNQFGSKTHSRDRRFSRALERVKASHVFFTPFFIKGLEASDTPEVLELWCQVKKAIDHEDMATESGLTSLETRVIFFGNLQRMARSMSPELYELLKGFLVEKEPNGKRRRKSWRPRYR